MPKIFPMVNEKRSGWKRFRKKLGDKYRLVVLNDSTFERKLSFRLSRLNVFIAVGAMAIFLITATIFIIAYTPLKEYIPGYGDVNMQRDLYLLQLKADSLQKDALRKNLYIENLKYIIEGRDFPDPAPPDPGDTGKKGYADMDFTVSEEDSALRKEFEEAGQFNLFMSSSATSRNDISSFFFFSPIKGVITNSYNPTARHFGVDIVTRKNEAVKATLDGTVIFEGWTVETGYIIAIQHTQNLISVYKHNYALLRKSGEFVKAGDPIAIVGETGEMSTGPHLHFELWFNGRSVNPKDFIAF